MSLDIDGFEEGKTVPTNYAKISFKDLLSIEDDQIIIDHEVDAAIDELENITQVAKDSEDDDEPEEIYSFTKPAAESPSNLKVIEYITAIKDYCKHHKLSEEHCKSLETVQRAIWSNRLSRPKFSPTINTFFSKKT